MSKLLSFIPNDWTKQYDKERAWLENQITDIGDAVVKKLIREATKVRDNAYTPYSKYHVGAAILTASGRIYSSCNAEVVSWSESDHAEQSTVTKAVSEGEIKRSGRKFVRAIAVVHDGDSGPCGRCRQVIAEHANNTVIVVAKPNGKIFSIVSLKMLLPLAFTPGDLEK